MTVTLTSCKHQENIVSINQENWEVIIVWKWKNSWSDANVIESVLSDVNIILNRGTDHDITVTFEQWQSSIPVVVWCPGNNSLDYGNNPLIYTTLSELLQWKAKTVKWQSVKEKILEILSKL